MNNENQKIIGYDSQTGQPIYDIQNPHPQVNYQQSINNTIPNLQSVNNENKNKQSKLIKILIITNVITFVLMLLFIVAFILKKPNIESIDINDKIEENKEYISTATTDPVSNDWKNYQFSIKGKTLTLPCTYQELSDISGFKMKSSDEKSYIERRSSTYVNLYTNDSDNNQKLALYIDIKNDTEEDMKYSDTDVVSISQTKSQVERYNADKIIFPGDLEVGMEMTKEQIIELFGEPKEIRDNSDANHSYLTLTYTEDETYSTINHYKILLVNGMINELTLDHKKNK